MTNEQPSEDLIQELKTDQEHVKSGEAYVGTGYIPRFARALYSQPFLLIPFGLILLVPSILSLINHFTFEGVIVNAVTIPVGMILLISGIQRLKLSRKK